jgi:hypothetical protein
LSEIRDACDQINQFIHHRPVAMPGAAILPGIKPDAGAKAITGDFFA